MKVIQVIPKLDLAGAEIMCENLTTALTDLDVEVVVVSLFNKRTMISERLEEKGIKIIYLNKRNGFDFQVIFDLIKVLKKEKPDVVHTHINVLIYVAVASMFAGVKRKVHTVHSVANEEATTFKQKLYYIIFHYMNVTPVALTKEIQESIVQRYRISEEKVPIIYNGIDLSKCKKKKAYNIDHKLTFLHIGRFADVKNHKMLIDAFSNYIKKVPDSELLLIGDGPLMEEIKYKVQKLNLTDKIHFLGQKSDVFSYLNLADAFIFPSIYEGMPMTLIEAMGTGLPIIATNVGGIPSMIKNNYNGILVKCEIDDIEKAMERVMDLTLREKLGSNALKTSAKFSSVNMAKSYMDIYL